MSKRWWYCQGAPVRHALELSGLSLLMLLALCSGCLSPRPLKPGVSRFYSSSTPGGRGQFASEMKQPENPAQSATQNFERTTESELPLAAGTKLTERIARPGAAPGDPPVITEKTVVLAEAAVQKTRVLEKAGTVLGAAQKDTTRELGAKLASLKGIVWVGLGLFVFGVGSLVWPPLRAIIGSVTTSAAILLGGVALMALPSLIVGNELLILGGVGLGVGAWFLAHRHGQARGMIEAGLGVGTLTVKRSRRARKQPIT